MINKTEINKGITLNYKKDNRFKTITTGVFFKTQLTKNDVTKTALLGECLRGGCKKYPSMASLSRKLEEMWGAVFQVSVVKRGDEQFIYLYLEGLTKDFMAHTEVLKDIMLTPLLDNQNCVNMGKHRLIESIKAVEDSKSEKTIEDMCSELTKNTADSFGIPVLGYVNKVEEITMLDLQLHLKMLLETAPIEIFVIGNEEESAVKAPWVSVFKNTQRNVNYPVNKVFHLEKEDVIEVIKNEGNNQGKLAMAFSLMGENDTKRLPSFLLLNEILGGSSNSRLFRVVREEESLCYSVSSFIFKQKMLLAVQAGIDKNKFETVVNLINQSIEGLKETLEEKELKEAKTSLVKAYETTQDVPGEIINFHISMGTSFEEFKKQVENTKLLDIKDLSKQLKCNIKYFLC